MGIHKDDLTLVAGMTLYDVDTKSIGILVRRFSTREHHYGEYDGSHGVLYPYDLVWEQVDEYVAWVWDSVWSRDGRVIYSEDGLKNLISAGIIVGLVGS